MKFAFDDSHSRNHVGAYGEGWLKVGGTTHRTSVLITRSEVFTDWGAASVAELRAEHMERLAALAPEIVILGTGATQSFPDPALLAPLMARRIGVEVMTTPAAARTFNLLAGDDRNVVAALML